MPATLYLQPLPAGRPAARQDPGRVRRPTGRPRSVQSRVRLLVLTAARHGRRPMQHAAAAAESRGRGRETRPQGCRVGG